MSLLQFLVIGAGRFGSAVAATLYEQGHEVVAIDTDEEALADLQHAVTHTAVVDAADERALRKLGVASFDMVIMAIGDDLEAGILATVTAKEAGARYVISKAISKTSARILASVGADEVVRPEHDMGVRLARQIGGRGRIDALELGPDHSVDYLEIGERLNGSLSELGLRSRFGVTVIAVRRDDDIVVIPPATFELAGGDLLTVVGSNAKLIELRRFLQD